MPMSPPLATAFYVFLRIHLKHRHATPATVAQRRPPSSLSLFTLHNSLFHYALGCALSYTSRRRAMLTCV